MGREVRDSGAVVFVVVAAVGELFAEAPADEETVVGIDGEVAGVKEGMEVGPKEEAVADLMGATLRVGTDVRSL
jgi:hypothetical protein